MSRAFDVAWFFRVSPSEVLALDVDEFLTWQAEAYRIAELRQRALTRSDDAGS